MPITPVQYQPRPYVRGGTLGELIRLRGQREAESHLRGGDISAQLYANLGSQLSGILSGYVKERQEAPIRAQDAESRALQVQAQQQQVDERDRLTRQDAAFTALLEQQPNPDPREVMRIFGPQRGAAIAQGMAAFGELSQQKVTDARDTAGRLAIGIKALSPALQASFWPSIRQAAVQGGLGDEQSIPEQFMPEFVEAVIGWASGKGPEAPPALMQRDPTRDLVDPRTGQVVSSGTPAAPEAPQVGSFEDYVTQRFGARPTPAQMTQARKDYKQSDDRPLVPVVIQTGAGPQLLDRTTQTASAITGPEGTPIGLAPTEGERNERRQYSKAKPIFEAISELSERINTGQGALAKLTGSVARAKASVNLNDDVAEYESLISGFTPMIARAVGHTGVLTEPDVQSVKRMFPTPGDSQSLRDRKIARLFQLMGAIEGVTASPGGGPVAAAVQTAPQPNLAGLREGSEREFRSGPFAGQVWTVVNGQPRQVR